MLAELDRLQVGQRGMVGRHLREAMQLTAQAQPPEVTWKLQRIVGEAGTAHLVFGACSSPYSDDIARCRGRSKCGPVAPVEKWTTQEASRRAPLRLALRARL